MKTMLTAVYPGRFGKVLYEDSGRGLIRKRETYSWLLTCEWIEDVSSYHRRTDRKLSARL